MARNKFVCLLLFSFLIVALMQPSSGQEPDQEPVLIRISTGMDGGPADSHSGSPSLSYDGRFIVFDSLAENLVAGKSNKCSVDPRFPNTPCRDIFLYDHESEQMRRISLAHDGGDADGRSTNSVISADGTKVAFRSTATNLVQDDTNEIWDVFVTDLQTSETKRVSVNSEGNEQEDAEGMVCGWACGRISISADGRFVMFDSWAGNLAPEDTNGQADVFVHDLLDRTTQRVSISSAGTEGNNPSWNPRKEGISGDGRFIVFQSTADNLTPGITNRCTAEIEPWGGVSCLDVFLRDLEKGTTTRISLDSRGMEGDADSSLPVISGNGRYVAFGSELPLSKPETKTAIQQIYVKDLETEDIEIISKNNQGQPGNDWSSWASMSHDGRYVVFMSRADDLFPGKRGDHTMTYVRDRELQVTVPVVLKADGFMPSEGPVGDAMISGDGQWITFSSSSKDILNGKSEQGEVYLTNQHLFLIDQIVAGELDAFESSTIPTIGILLLAVLLLGTLVPMQRPKR